MINEILKQDTQLFLFINHLPHNPIINSFFALLSGVGYWGIGWGIILVILFILGELKDKKVLLVFLFSGICTLLFTDLGLKNIVRRLRPEFVIPQTLVIFDHSRSFSFPSGHATIAFAAAFILGREHKKLRWLYYLLAILISFSRIYLGKHYPSDVIVGAIIGLLIGQFSIYFINRFTPRPNKLKRSR